MMNDIYENKRIQELSSVDDWSSAWSECKKLGLKWGGRGMGGRAAGRTTVQSKDVVVEGCTMSYLSTNLLNRTTLRLLQGRRYGLVGRNGVGKSTLLQRIASSTLPGFPTHITVGYVKQDFNYGEGDDLIAEEYILKNDAYLKEVEARIIELEDEVDREEVSPDIIEQNANELAELYEIIEGKSSLLSQIIKCLKDIGFSDKRRQIPVRLLSGGWKMRVTLAAALVHSPQLLLLDEPTNHLDLEGIEWLKRFIAKDGTSTVEHELSNNMKSDTNQKIRFDYDATVLVISHDRSFLDDVCTDIIDFRNQELHYYPGNYSHYEETKREQKLNKTRLQENLDKQRKHIEETVKKLQIISSKSENKNGTVASRKKKLNRVGCEKNIHGHKFKAQQDSYNGLSSIRAGSRNGYETGESRSLIECEAREVKLKFPSAQSGGSCLSVPLISLRNVTVGYKRDDLPFKAVLNNITLDIHSNSKISILGKNGCGKSTLLRLIVESAAGSTDANESSEPIAVSPSDGSLLLKSGLIAKTLSGLRIGFYKQQQQDALPYDLCAVDYFRFICEKAFSNDESAPAIYLTTGQNKESCSTLQKGGFSDQAIRAHLGAFGIGGSLALCPIGTLSGGQKCRIVFAEMALYKPNLMIFDEPTNNLDLDSVKALSEALQAFDSAIVIVSHDVRFIQEVTGECYQITNVCSNTNSKASNTMIKSNSKGKNATKSSVTTTPCMNGGHGLKRLEGGVIEYQQSIQEYLKATS